MEALVLLPGFMADGRVFADQIGTLSKDAAVMAAPLIGQDIPQMAENILRIAPPKFAVAGHGLGGAVASEILKRASDRVTRIALISASAQAETPGEAGAREPRMIKARTGRFGEALMEELPSTSLAQSPHRNAIRDYWIDMAMELGPEVYQTQSRILQRRPDYQNVLRRARLPALVVGGSADTICPPRRQDFIAQLMPRAEFVEIENAGHLPMLEAQQTLSAALQKWLAAEPPLVLR